MVGRGAFENLWRTGRKRIPGCRHRSAGGVWLLLILLIFGIPLSAQDEETTGPPPETPQPSSVFKIGEIARNVWSDQKQIWTTPARMKARQWLTVAAPVTVFTAGLIATDEDAMTVLPNSSTQLRWGGRVSDLGALYSLGGLSAGILVTGKLTKKNWLSRVGQGSTEALLDSMIVSYSIKYGTARERPTENEGKGRFWKGGDSFPSGHSMHTWAVATSIARTRNCPKWLAILSYSMAGVVSVSRWSAEKHFPSDVVVGGVLGWFIGNHVARRPR